MSALLTMRTFEVTGHESTYSHAAGETGKGIARNVALFVAAPFISLAYLLAIPFVGIGALIWISAKVLMERIPAIRAIAMTVVAPFVGLIFIAVMPILGMVALVWAGSRSLTVS